jgi:hypothetical protein
MNRKIIISVATGTALGMAILAVTNVTQAFDMGNMMKPGEWFDNNDDDHYRYGRGYGGGYGPYGGGYGPYGGYGGPYGGYGPYRGGYPGYGQPSTIVVNPSSGTEQAAPPPRLPE